VKASQSASSRAAPAGFSPLERRSPVTDPWRALYSRRDEQSIIRGLTIAEQHFNGRGFLHGA
jgi:hypothetical protein